MKLHDTACRFCKRPIVVRTVQDAPPNLARILARAECLDGDGCAADGAEPPDDPGLFDYIDDSE